MTNVTLRRFVQFVAYIAILLILASMTVGAIFPKTADICKIISSVLGLIVTAMVAFSYAKSKRSVIFMILLVIALIAIVALYFV